MAKSGLQDSRGAVRQAEPSERSRSDEEEILLCRSEERVAAEIKHPEEAERCSKGL